MSRNQITLGIRSSEGRKRLQISATGTGTSLKSQIKALILPNNNEDFVVKKDKDGRPGQEVKFTRASTISSLGLKNGDVLYVTPKAGTRFVTEDADENIGNGNMSTSGSSTSLASMASVKSSNNNSSIPFSVEEDPVDIELAKLDGMIPQKKTSRCNCSTSKQGCVYCAPREPYDPEYLRENGIKFMSFHSYLRKLKREKTKFASIEDINLKIKPGCPKGCTWPESICSACQPNALTLNRQTYRHVDNIEFENPTIVDEFLAYWRSTGHQRAGFLYGRYEKFTQTPLGIKAVVVAIYEPPQECDRDYVRLIPDENEGRVDAMAKGLGLTRVGWIFTDLVSDSSGQVKHFRNIDSHFLSSQECIMAGYLQNKFANVTKLSSSGKHGSKFVTVCVTGSADRSVHMEGYQVSNQCMALVRENVLLPTKDAPELGYVRESSSKQYVPDVFYKEKDKYGNEITKIARPLPVEYLLIDIAVATPLTPVQTFSKGFPVENRAIEGHLQDFASLASLRHKMPNLPDFFRDFHLLIYLGTQTVQPMLDEELRPLLEAIRDEKTELVFDWAESSHWRNIEALIQNYNDGYQ